MMKPVTVGWLVVLCCTFAAASAVQDNVLRFLSHKEVVRMTQDTKQKFGAQSKVCPNDITQCPNSSTCCPLLNGQYGCCHGVNEEQAPISESLDIVCPDQSSCPSGNTCCKLSTGNYGCCPMPNAVCCSDGVHCCPSGSTCDLAKGTCDTQQYSIPLVKKVPAIHRSLDIVCPDQSSCPSGNTCCKLSTGNYGCCPMPNAVCCSDGVHCCPSGSTCDLAKGTCDTQQYSIPLVKKVPAIHRSLDVVCPDQSSCPSGNTCCKLSTGNYGCCPMPNAVCCSDGVHCCPSGSTCDLAKLTCDTQQYSIPLVKKVPAIHRSLDIVCPDQSSCPSGNTCCKLSTGNYGCCPMPNAVCCSDGVHCCPSGSTCDLAKGTCDTQQYSIPLVKKVPAIHRSLDIVCPDQSSCPSGNTCCKLSTGNYGCCPMPNAVCCSDGVHCCPSGSTCDLAKGTCDTQQYSIPLVKKVPAIHRSLDVVCPDQSSCPSGNTCCKLSTGNYGCCPMPNAVCCSDGVHCCPEGTTCDLAKLTCDTQQYSIPLVKNLPAIHRSLDIVCPDQSSCPSNNTCCKMSTGNYGCCPMPNAVCCSDGVHCCPEGTTCDMAKLTCNTQQYSIPLVKKVSAIHSAQNVVCPDHQSECPSGSTCCKLSTGNYGCCPRPNAVCCSDGVHCCPSGSTCDLAKGTCDTQQYSIPLVKKVPAIHSLP